MHTHSAQTALFRATLDISLSLVSAHFTLLLGSHALCSDLLLGQNSCLWLILYANYHHFVPLRSWLVTGRAEWPSLNLFKHTYSHYGSYVIWILLNACYMDSNYLFLKCHLPRWFSGSVFACRSRGLVFVFYTVLHCLNVNFSKRKKGISEAPHDQGVKWYPERAVSVQVWYFWAPYVGCIQNRGWNSFPGETRKLVSYVAQWQGEVKCQRVAEQLQATLPKLVT